MYQANDAHRQIALISDLDVFPPKLIKILKSSWAQTFYDEFFSRIDEGIFAVLYSDEPSRPNIAVNVLVGLNVLKAGFGWSDEAMYHRYCFDAQVRYALGYRNFGVGHFELRTMYNFRKALSDHMQRTGTSLMEQMFEQVTDAQLKKLAIKTNMLRMDSTQIASNIRDMGRLQTLVEVLQRVHRMLTRSEQDKYAQAFAGYMKGSSGQYIYQLKGKDIEPNLEMVGQLMQRLLAELGPDYGAHASYQLLERVFGEHFEVHTHQVITKEAKELSASSLQSPDDPEASFRHKGNQNYVGYVANVTETCDPENKLNLIVKVQVEPNTTSDQSMLAAAIPNLKARTQVERIYTDGGFSSHAVDILMNHHQIEQYQTAITNSALDPDLINLVDFEWAVDGQGYPLAVTCPFGEQTPVILSKQTAKGRYYRADFHSCVSCPSASYCPRPTALKTQPVRRLYITQKNLDRARRRQRIPQARNTHGKNLRAAIEATVRSIKHPFRRGKLPVRGLARMRITVTAVAIMANVRRIWRYFDDQKHKNQSQNQENQQQIPEKSPGSDLSSFFVFAFSRWHHSFIRLFSSAWRIAVLHP